MAAIPNPFGFVVPFMLSLLPLVYVLSFPSETRPGHLSNHEVQHDHAFGQFSEGFGLTRSCTPVASHLYTVSMQSL